VDSDSDGCSTAGLPPTQLIDRDDIDEPMYESDDDLNVVSYWMCNHCYAKNDGIYTLNCYLCHEPRFDGSVMWSCPCGQLNFAVSEKSRCAGCKRLRFIT
jgi:hypothetical protein